MQLRAEFAADRRASSEHGAEITRFIRNPTTIQLIDRRCDAIALQVRKSPGADEPQFV
jgi:hypothetical protein